MKRNFETYDRQVVAHMQCKGMRQKDIFSVLDNPPVFKVDRALEREQERLKSKLYVDGVERGRKLELMSDKTNRYIVDTEAGIIHDRTCSAGKALPVHSFTMRPDYENGLKRCKHCEFQLLIRRLATYDEEYQNIRDMLKDPAVSLKDIVLLAENNVRIRHIKYNLLELNAEGEHWRIEKQGSCFLLHHNNYQFINGRKVYTKGFHLQKTRGKTFHHAADEMLRYNPYYHVIKAERAEKTELDKALKQAPENDILREEAPNITFNYPIAFRLRGRGIVFDYFVYLDCEKDFSAEICGENKLLYRRLSEADGKESCYKLIICKVLRWQRKRFLDILVRTKKRMYREGYIEGYAGVGAIRRYFGNIGIELESI